jgi:hypothetical protein
MKKAECHPERSEGSRFSFKSRFFVSLRMTTVFSFLIVSFHFSSRTTANIRSGFTPEKANFAIQFKEETTPYRISSAFLLPGEKTTITISENLLVSTLTLSGQTSGWERKEKNVWTVTAPLKPGLYPVTFSDESTGDSILFNVFVLVPMDRVKNGVLNGYKIGKYPAAPANKQGAYPQPRGFIEVTNENKHTLITPHFRLGQFLCKQSGSYPKYIVLRERLPLKLEALMQELNEKGVPCTSLAIMSGYRTPHYNRSLGNVRFSRHMWGDAADIFIDSEPGENYMADLNGDGKRDIRDGEVLFNTLDSIEKEPEFARYVGGLAKYKPTRSHGPFVHVDARGAAKRWNH